jgi:hypothetical protein
MLLEPATPAESGKANALGATPANTALGVPCSVATLPATAQMTGQGGWVHPLLLETWTRCNRPRVSRGLPSRCLQQQSAPFKSDYADSRPLSRAVSSLAELLANLQGQVSSLGQQMGPAAMNRQSEHYVAPVSQSSKPNGTFAPSAWPPAPASGGPGLGPYIGTPENRVSGREPGAPHTPTNSRKQRTRRPFCGPTSPEYSLNVAQSRMRQGSFSDELTGGRLTLATIDDNVNDEDFDNAAGDDDVEATSRVMDQLTRFQTLLAQRDVLRLMFVYQEVNGDFYPIVNMDSIREHVEALYGWLPTRSPLDGAEEPNDCPVDQESLLILNLALAIALCAGEVSNGPSIAKTIYSNCRDVINVKLASPAESIKPVVIALLVVRTLDAF